MFPKVLSTAIALALSTHSLFAGALVEVDLAPIEHLDASLVVVGTDATEIVYSPSELEALATYSLTTTTPWREEPAEFEGVLLADILAASGLDTVNSIVVTAENDYKTVLERAQWENVEILVATRVDGTTISRRTRGPILFVIDMETLNTSNLATESALVWMASRIEAES